MGSSEKLNYNLAICLSLSLITQKPHSIKLSTAFCQTAPFQMTAACSYTLYSSALFEDAKKTFSVHTRCTKHQVLLSQNPYKTLNYA